MGRDLRGGPQPSRQSPPPAILASSDAGAQRSGDALPALLPRGSRPGLSLEAARLTGPFKRTLNLASSPHGKLVFRSLAESHKVARTNRRRIVRDLASLAAKLGTQLARLQRKLRRVAPARILRIPLIAFLANKIGYHDNQLPADLTKGVESTSAIAHLAPWAIESRHQTGGLRHFVTGYGVVTHGLPTQPPSPTNLSLGRSDGGDVSDGSQEGAVI